LHKYEFQACGALGKDLEDYDVQESKQVDSLGMQHPAVELTLVQQHTLSRTQSKTYLLDDDPHVINELPCGAHTSILHHDKTALMMVSKTLTSQATGLKYKELACTM
jgi:hypothetical protein